MPYNIMIILSHTLKRGSKRIAEKRLKTNCRKDESIVLKTLKNKCLSRNYSVFLQRFRNTRISDQNN